ncbi:MAG: dTDP-4-dehydrorhamnose reductase [Pseudomonadota bacterium]
MRLLIAGWQGQVARALVETAPGCADIEACAVGRPGLDICEAATITRAMADVRPDIIINSAAYTAVDQAESDVDAAFRLNRDGAGLLAQAAAQRDLPIIHISTDYVFDGAKAEPYREDDATTPASVYGHSKLAGEVAVRGANPRHIILRTAWVYSPFGKNFVKTMLNLAQSRDDLGVVADQVGSPTYAPHLSAAILEIARQVVRKGEKAAFDDARWGLYHAVGHGETSWHGLAQAVFARAAHHGAKVPSSVRAIETAQYPTPAQRPANSRLDTSKLADTFDVRLPPWQEGVDACVDRLLGDD